MARMRQDIELPDGFSDGAKAELKTALSKIATKIVAEASRLQADDPQNVQKVYESHVRDAFDQYFTQPTRWQKAKPWINAASALTVGVGGTLLAVAGSKDSTIMSNHFPWVVLSLFLTLNALACFIFMAYKGD